MAIGQKKWHKLVLKFRNEHVCEIELITNMLEL